MMDKNRSSRNSLLRYAFLLPIALGLVIACNSKEEELSDKPTVAVTSMKDQVKDVANEVFTVVEEMPEYPGGTNELLAYISKNIKYPEAAEKAGVEGRVICSFVVTKEGKVADVNVVRGVSPELDDEAIRVISSMPTWKPGKQKGEVVNVKYTLPIMFRLQGGSTETGSGDQVKEKVTEKSL